MYAYSALRRVLGAVLHHVIPPAPALVLAGLSLAPAAGAGVLVAYDFEDAAGAFEPGPEILAEGLAASSWSDVDGALTDFTGAPGRALAARDWDDGNAFVLSLRVLAGRVLALEGFTFDQRASSSGPLSWVLHVAGTAVGAGETTTDFSTVGDTLALGGLTGEVPVVLEAGGASSSGGTWRIDNLRLLGELGTVASTVPAPAPVALMASGLGLLGLARAISRARAPRGRPRRHGR